MKLISILSIIMNLAGSLMYAQNQADTLQQTSRDSIVHITPIPDIGSVEPYNTALTTISAQDIPFHEYRSAYDLLSSLPGVFVRELASPGREIQIILNGAANSRIAIMIDGIPYNDPYTGTFNLWNIPVEDIDKIEFTSQPGSIFYDGVSTGGVINIITKNYSNNRAYTKLRYSQGVDGYVQTDAMFAQNIERNLNLTFGLTHYGFGSNKESKGYIGRFYNSNDDAWGFRGKIRYNVTDDFNVAYSYHYTKTWTGLNGGVDYYTTTSLFDGLSATVNNYDSYEKLDDGYSNLTLAFKPSADSIDLFTVTGYYFDRLREYRDEENRFNSNGITRNIDFPSTTRGLKTQFVHDEGMDRLTIIGLFERNDAARRTYINRIGIQNELSVFNPVSIMGFVSWDDNAFSYGGRATLSLYQTLSFYCAASFNPTSFINISNNTEAQYEAGIQVDVPQAFNGKVFFHQAKVNSPLSVLTTLDSTLQHYFLNLESAPYLYKGIAAYVHTQWNDVHLEGTVNYLQQPNFTFKNAGMTLYPKITLDGSIYYSGLLANGHFNMKGGFRGRYYSEQTGMSPDDQSGLWGASTIAPIGKTGTVDFFLTGKIGDAYIHLIWENLGGNNYYLSPIYPMYGRNIRFGVTWEFTD